MLLRLRANSEGA